MSLLPKTKLSIAILLLIASTYALENGLGRVPQMGWNPWNIFYGNIDQKKMLEVAHAMKDKGMLDAGYEYFCLDDNWMDRRRDSQGRLKAHPTRFSKGIKWLADTLHAMGFKFGIYGDRGTMTCMNIPYSGSYGNEQLDAETFAAWDVDYLKYDNCNASWSTVRQDYEKMSGIITKVSRPIFYAICCWGYNGDWMMPAGNSWRTTSDIAASWNLLGSITDQNHKLFPSAGPGYWNDPDMLEVGNGQLTTNECISHFSLWCIMAAPLIAGNDVRRMNNTIRDIYCNKEAIAVDQDSLGVQGRRVRDEGNYEVWLKPLKSWVGKEKAVVLFNRSGSSRNMNVKWEEVGLDPTKAATVRDLWKHQDMGSFTGEYSTSVANHGSAMLKIVGEPKLSPPTQDSYLSDLEWYHMANGFGPAEKDKSNGNAGANDGRTITLNGTTYSKGLGTHAPSELVYYLGGKGLKFTADVGVDDEVGNSGSVQFRVLGDMKQLYASGGMYGNTSTKKIDVDISGVQVLRLLVTQYNSNTTSDHASWGNARITYTNVPIVNKPLIRGYKQLQISNSILKYSVVSGNSSETHVAVRLYDVKGSLVKVLVNEVKEHGTYSIDLKNLRLATGMYVCSMEMSGHTESTRFVMTQ